MLPWVLGGAAVGLLYLTRGKQKAPTKPPALKEQPKAPSVIADSPINGVEPQTWLRFMAALGDRDHARAVTESGHLGFFRFGMPRLAELGLACNVRRDKVGSRKVWVGDFVPPLTREQFLSDLGLQSRVFALSSGDFATFLAESRPKDLGQLIDGQGATLSGLLAVLHRAGISGYEKWLSKPDDHPKFPHTTAAYKAANKLF
jgi:hypothetical protein